MNHYSVTLKGVMKSNSEYLVTMTEIFTHIERFKKSRMLFEYKFISIYSITNEALLQRFFRLWIAF